MQCAICHQIFLVIIFYIRHATLAHYKLCTSHVSAVNDEADYFFAESRRDEVNDSTGKSYFALTQPYGIELRR